MNELHKRYVASVPAPSTTVPPRGQIYQGWTRVSNGARRIPKAVGGILAKECLSL